MKTISVQYLIKSRKVFFYDVCSNDPRRKLEHLRSCVAKSNDNFVRSIMDDGILTPICYRPIYGGGSPAWPDRYAPDECTREVANGLHRIPAWPDRYAPDECTREVANGLHRIALAYWLRIDRLAFVTNKAKTSNTDLVNSAGGLYLR